MKNPTIATLLNIIPGIGYIYVGQRVVFGVTLLVSGIIATIASMFNPLMQEYYAADLNVWDWITLASSLIIVGGFMYDAYRDAITANASNNLKPAKK